MSAERWACALAAPIRKRVGLDLEGLAAGMEPEGRKGDRFCREQLRGIANIHDRGDVLKGLPLYLEGGGSRREYAEYRKWHDELPKEAQSAGYYLLDQTVRLKRVFVHDHAGRPEETSVAAWDCARIVHYAGLAYGAAFLAEHEAWSYVLAASRLALETYSSWQEYARGYVYGRWFWQGYWEDGMKATQEAIDELLADPEGYRDLPWPIDLAPLQTLAREAPRSKVESTALEGLDLRLFIDCPSCVTPILVRDASRSLRCDACGAESEPATLAIWTHALAEDEEDEEEDEDDEEDDEEEEEADDASGVDLYTNLDDQLQRALKRPAASEPKCAGCGASVAPDKATEGVFRCVCGRPTPVVPAPDWLRKIAPRARWVVGGPLCVGRPDDFLRLLLETKR